MLCFSSNVFLSGLYDMFVVGDHGHVVELALVDEGVWVVHDDVI